MSLTYALGVEDDYVYGHNGLHYVIRRYSIGCGRRHTAICRHYRADMKLLWELLVIIVEKMPLRDRLTL